MESENPRQTCLKLEIPSSDESEPRRVERVFVKGTWFPSRFDLSITNGLHGWICNASEEEVEERASQWDQPVSEYIDMAEKYLGFQQPGSVYGFSDAGAGHRRLSWTFEKEGTKLEWRWKCKPSPDSKNTTADILDFLMDANIQLSEEVLNKTQAFERLQIEAGKCLAQSEKLVKEKEQFESAIYAKFLGVLNSKKAKLRELRDRLPNKAPCKQAQEEEEEGSTDRTETFDEESNEEKSGEEMDMDAIGTSKDTPTKKGKSSWPELVGVEAEIAKATIERENNLVTAKIVFQQCGVPEDFRCNRVWVFVNCSNVVASVPVIG
nr:DNA repair protein XRCC4 [Ipomoea batatas]